MKSKTQFVISVYGWTYWLPILIGGAVATVTLALTPAWWLAIVAAVLTAAGLAFFRDFPRRIPGEPGLMVSPADGKVTEVTPLPHFEPFGGPALRVGIFLSVLDVHVNRSPCDGVVVWTKFEHGLFLDARHLESGVKNQSNTVALADTAGGAATVVVKQIVGAIARRIICPLEPGDALCRGERFGMIAFGSRTELYVPRPADWEVKVTVGQHLKAGCDVVLVKR